MKKKKIIVNKWDIILVRWIDASGSVGWVDIEDYTTKPYYVYCVGMFVGEDNDSWVLCMNDAYTSGSISGITCIPKGMIQNVQILKRAV